MACHLDEGKLSGPLEPAGMMTPHPISIDADRYQNSEFCGRCHEGTLAQWQAAPFDNKLTCQQCHMPAIHRKVTQATSLISKVIVAMEKPEDQKSHTFAPVPQELEIEPFSISITPQSNSNNIYLLTLRNNLPHSLPTGDFGVRIVAINVTAVDDDGHTASVANYELIKELKTAVAPGTSRQWKLDLPPQSAKVLVSLLRYGRDKSKSIELFSTEVSLP